VKRLEEGDERESCYSDLVFFFRFPVNLDLRAPTSNSRERDDKNNKSRNTQAHLNVKTDLPLQF